MKRLISLLLVPALAAADNLVSYTGTFTETDHPTIAGAHVVTLTSHGTLTVSADVRLLRLLVVGGGGGGGLGGGAGGQVVDWTPETPTFLKRDDAYQVVVGPCGYRSNQGSQQARGHNGFPSSVSCASFEVVALGGGGARGWGYSNDSRWDVESPQTWGNGGGGACDQQLETLVGFPAGAEGCFPGGNATNKGSSGTGCGGGGGGAGAGGPGGDSQVLNTAKNNDATQDENGNYEHAGDGGPGVVSDITGVAVSYGDGGGGGVRRSNFKHGGVGGLGGGGRGAGLFEGSVGAATDAAPNRGGGGGGGGWNASGTTLQSANGAAGVVIFLVAPAASGEAPSDRDSPKMRGGTAKTWRDAETKKTWAVHEFRGSGTLDVSGGGLDVELLLVGGGGSGGTATGGGGGAGGLVHTNGLHLSGGVYDVTVGAGGIADGGDGGASSLVSRDGRVSLTAPGGGAGGCYGGGSARYAGHPGGSGGGGAVQKAGGAAEPGDGVVIGHAGGNAAPSGYNPGGGGGAGSPGGDAKAGSTSDCLGNGGDGLAYDITGESRFYAGGGGAGWSGSSNVRGNHGIGGSGVGGDGETALQSASFRRPWGHAGLDGTGSGGGGGGQTSGVGGKGGCGVLIVRYEVPPQGTVVLVK